MPDRRDDFQQRRAPQRFERRRPSRAYDDYMPESGRGRRMDDGGYVGSRSSGERRRMLDDFYPERRSRAMSAAPGEYLADSQSDRYAEPMTPADDDFFEEDHYEYPRRQRFSRRGSAAEESVDFSDLDAYDPDDDWFAQRVASPAAKAVPEEEPVREEYPASDGFEDAEDRPQDTERRFNRRREVRFEEDMNEKPAAYSMPESFSAAAPDSRKKGNTIAIVCIVLALLVGAGIFGAVLLNGAKTLLPLETVVKKMDDTQCKAMVAAHVDRRLSEISCNVTVDGNVKSFPLSDCEMTFAAFDEDKSSRYETGTNESTGEVVRTEYAVDGNFRYNKTKLREYLDSLLSNTSVPVVDPYFEIDYDTGKMTVYAGSDGWGVDYRKFLSQLNSSLMAVPGNTVSISCTSGTITAQPLSAEEIYKQAATEPVDAYTTTDSAGNTVYHSEINGVEFSQSELAGLIAAGGTSWELQVKVTRPEIDLKEIKKYTFPDVLSTYYTYYVNTNYARSHNLALSAEHINSTILEPGEQFSFNDVVGERTPENGFKKATVYLGEGTAEDYGGGICQTSSTLYYTCILANLQIDDRTNHMYTVNYMQTANGRRTVYGNDATVNWGYSDYKFSNNKEYPIRIDMWAKGGILTCEIRGTADGSTADFEYDILSSTPYNIKYLKANGSPTQEGHTGYRVNVYRVIYQDGVEVERVLESKNTYQPMTKVYYTDEIPEGFEYGVEYPQDYVPPTTTTTTPAPTQSTDATATTTAVTP